MVSDSFFFNLSYTGYMSGEDETLHLPFSLWLVDRQGNPTQYKTGETIRAKSLLSDDLGIILVATPNMTIGSNITESVINNMDRALPHSLYYKKL